METTKTFNQNLERLNGKGFDLNKSLNNNAMNDLIINYNHNNRAYKRTGKEVYNDYCKKILNTVAKLDENQREVFNKNTAFQVYEA